MQYRPDDSQFIASCIRFPIRRQLGRRNRPPQPWGRDDFSAASKNSDDVEMAHPDARQHHLMPTSPKFDESDMSAGGAPAAAVSLHNEDDDNNASEEDVDDTPEDLEYSSTMSDSKVTSTAPQQQPTHTLVSIKNV